MKNITGKLKEIFLPQKALVIYGSLADEHNVFVEAYDFTEEGKPFNAHPLSMLETADLAESLNTSRKVQTDYLQCRGVIPDSLLFVRPNLKGYAIWYTPAQKVNLLFTEGLNIPCGSAHVPAMVWKAGKDRLEVFALKSNRKSQASTSLYHAPFFNVYNSGNVCMGTVDTDFSGCACMEDFMHRWQEYFWGSHFSHLLEGCPVKGNIVQLWQGLINTDQPFPHDVLKKNGKTLKDLLP